MLNTYRNLANNYFFVIVFNKWDHKRSVVNKYDGNAPFERVCMPFSCLIQDIVHESRRVSLH